MRPRLDGSIEDRIRKHMEDAGWDSEANFVRYCVNKELDRREALASSDDA